MNIEKETFKMKQKVVILLYGVSWQNWSIFLYHVWYNGGTPQVEFATCDLETGQQLQY